MTIAMLGSSEKEFDARLPEMKAKKGTLPPGPFVRAIKEVNDQSPTVIEDNLRYLAEGLKGIKGYFKNDFLIDFLPIIPIEVEGKQQLYFNSKALGRDLALLTIMTAGALATVFCSRQSSGGGQVPVPTPDSGNNNNSDCGAIITAMNGLATQIGAESFSVIGVDVTHIDSVEEITPDIRQACFIPGAANIEIAAQLDNFTIVSFIAPDGDQDGGLRPVIGVVDRGAAGADGVAPMMLVDATDSGLSVGRNSAGELTVGLDQACLDGNGVKGCSQAVMELVAQDDDLNAFAVNVLGQVALGPVLLSADQVGRLAGGGDILGMAYAQKDKEAALSSFDQQAGMQADLAAISGSSGNVGGEPGEAFAPGVEVMQKINDQGFWVVADNGQLNVDMDHTQVVNATDSIFWNQDPREILELQKSADGKAMVFVENGINFVVFSKGEIKQKQIIAAPAIFGDNLELSTLIVKDVNQIPEGLRQGLDLRLGTTVLAVVNKNTGEVMQLIPSIFDFNDEVTLASIGEGQLILTVNNDGGEQKFQMQTVATDGWAESLLPQQVKEKFEQAGISLTDMTNAELKPDGLHITLDGEKTIDVKTEELNNFVNHKNYVTLEEEHFLPVWNSETKESSIFTFDKENKIWMLSEILEPLELSKDPNNAGKCTYKKDVISGHLAESLRTQEITFPEGAVNEGWDYKKGEAGTAPIYLSTDSKDVMQIVNICRISNDFLGLNTQSYVLSVAILNPDDSVGYINFFVENKGWLDKVISKINNTEGTGVGIFKKHNEGQIKNAWNHPVYAPFVRLYAMEGEDQIELEINKLQINDIASNSFSKLLVSPNLR